MISTLDLCKQFRKVSALKNVNLTFAQGKSYALIGPNGSGKTTLIKSILGMVLPTSGQVMVGDEDIVGTWDYRKKIGYMPQIGRYPDNMRVDQLFDMMKNIRKSPSDLDEELIDSFQLHKVYEKRFHTLSGGMRQRVSAALAFLFNPPILTLDEPTSGLDPVSVEILKTKVQKERGHGKLIIISSHVMSDLEELCAEVVYLFEGQVHYSNGLEDLLDITGERRLGSAIARLMTRRSNEAVIINKEN
jgi:Cu-processing system ATP-binding protein